MGSVLSAGTKRWLVEEAEQILDGVARDKGFQDQTSQLRNLVQIVQDEAEVSVLRNFIRYQTGRKMTSIWNLIHEKVIRVLEKIDKDFAADDHLRKAAIQQFFGYLVRHYVYLDKVNRERRDSSRAQAGGRR